MPLAGAVNLILTPETTLVLARGGMLSPGFRCKTFDAAADGFVRGEGCGIVVLKRLSNALRDGDRILALIRGLGGESGWAQQRTHRPQWHRPSQALLRAALADAGLEPGQVQYIEAHGTGASLGDPVEVQALAAVFGPDRPSAEPLLAGSIKTNFGHLEVAAGMAGLIKLILALQHGEIPPHLHLQTLNPHLDWSSIPLKNPHPGYPPGRVIPFRALEAFSSFGFSGTNSHLLLSPGPGVAAAPAGRERTRRHLLCLSAK